MRRQVRARKQTSRSPTVLVRREQISAANGEAVHAVWRGHVRLCSWVRCVFPFELVAKHYITYSRVRYVHRIWLMGPTRVYWQRVLASIAPRTEH